MLCVVSGQTVVHSESSNPSMTTLPRNWLSDMCWPNWFVRLISGAGWLFSEAPRSRLGLASAAALAVLDAEGCPGDDEPHPASATAVMTAAKARLPRVSDFTTMRLLHEVVSQADVVPLGSGSAGSSPTITPPPCPQAMYRQDRLISVWIRFRYPSRYSRCRASQASHARNPVIRKPLASCTTAELRPIVAMVPLS